MGPGVAVLWVVGHRKMAADGGGSSSVVGSRKPGQLTVFASPFQELHISGIVDRSSFFGSPFGSTVGSNFCDAQCRKTHILSLDLYLSSPLEIALHWVKFRFASNRWPVALDSQQLLHLVELRLVGSFHSNRTSLYFLKLIFKVIFINKSSFMNQEDYNLLATVVVEN
jgi:hypothetical protein